MPDYSPARQGGDPSYSPRQGMPDYNPARQGGDYNLPTDPHASARDANLPPNRDHKGADANFSRTGFSASQPGDFTRTCQGGDAGDASTTAHQRLADALDLRAGPGQLALDPLVAAIDVIHTVDDGLALGHQRRDHQAGARA